MNDIDQRLNEMFDRRGGDVGDSDDGFGAILRRSRRRKVATITLAVVSVALVVAVPIGGIALHDAARDRKTRPAMDVVLPDAPAGFEQGVVPYASIAYPDGWYLLDTSPLTPMGIAQPDPILDGPILQLSNVDPDVARSPRCFVSDEWPADDAVMLTVGVYAKAELFDDIDTSDRWPVEPAPYPPNTDPSCREQHEQAIWTADNGLVYWASIGWGRDASPAEIDAVQRAFESLRVPSTDAPWLSTMAAYRGQGSPRAVLGTTVRGDDVLTFVAYLELYETLWVGVESNGQWTTATGPHTGSTEEPVQAGLSVVGRNATLLDGVISPRVSRVEVRTGAGDVAPMQVVPIPASLGVDDRYVWALIDGSDEDAAVVGYDEHGEPIGVPNYAVEPSRQIASGEEAGEPWSLEVTHDNSGWGLNMTYDNGSGGGGGIDLGDKAFGSIGISGPSWDIESGYSTTSLNASGVVTDRAAAMSYELVDGSTLDAQLFDVPADAFGGGAKAFVMFVPVDVLVNAGDLVLYDAAGDEIARQYFDASPVALFPKVLEEASPEALDAMRDLQLAGGVAARYFYDHDGQWTGFDPAAASAISGNVTYNASTTAITGEVSLRVTGKTALVLATRTPAGDVYSACFQGDAAGGTMEGRNDPTDASECSNGWLNEP
jgi:hypothetical protein